MSGKWFATLLASLLMAIVFSAQATPVVLGYYYLSADEINQLDTTASLPYLSQKTVRELTHLNFSFLNIDTDGRCVLPSTIAPDKAALLFDKLHALKTENPDLRINATLGGWENSNDDSPTVRRYREAAATVSARNRLVLSCTALLQHFHLDGLDIDWEYPRAEDAENFTQLLRAFRLAFEPAHYELSIAGAGGAFNLARTYPQLAQMATAVDYINLMTYDFNGPWQAQTNHHAHLFGDPDEPLYDNPLRRFLASDANAAQRSNFPPRFALTTDAAVQQYLIAGVPANKIVLGVPFYGRAFFQTQTRNRGLFQSFNTPAGDDYRGDLHALYGCAHCPEQGDPRTPSFADIQRLREGHYGYRYFFSNKSKASWLYHPKQHIFVSYEDPASLHEKARYARQQGLAGMMYWRIGQDDASDSLLHAMRTALDESGACEMDTRESLVYRREMLTQQSSHCQQK